MKQDSGRHIYFIVTFKKNMTHIALNIFCVDSISVLKMLRV